jgi:hypothetical protein
MKTPGFPAATVRTLLANAYAAHGNPLVREALATVGSATIVQGAYSLSELIAIEQRISGSPIPLPGWTGVGTDLASNKVAVMFEDSTALQRGLSMMGSLGIPADALEPVIMPPLRFETASFQDRWRPTGGGIEASIGNDTAVPGYCCKNGVYVYEGMIFSLGYNVRATSGIDYFMTAAHSESMWRGYNGVIGDSIFQPSRLVASGLIGKITNNPRYNEGAECPYDAVYQRNYDFCTTADAMLGTYFAGVTYARKVGTSVRGGVIGDTFGGVGSQSVNGFYTINAVLPPEYVRDTLHHDVAKSGRTTGTTSGRILTPMGDFPFSVCFPDQVNCTPSYRILLQRQGQVYAANAGGDSGAPVFTGNPNNGAPYAALGILTAGTGINCNSSSLDCYFVFSRWDMIEQRLGLGNLNPRTTIP